MNVLLRTIREVDKQPGAPPVAPDTPLLGLFDSLGVVELLIKLEEAFGREYGISPNLLGNPDVIAPGGPLDTVGSLARYLEDKANARSN